METIKLDLIPSGVAPVVHVSQYDEGRQFRIDLFEGGSSFVLDGTETLTVNVRKPDGHLVVETVTNTSDSYVVIDTTEQMTAVKGTNLSNLKIEKGSVTIATLNFLMNVEVDPLENGDPSESFVSNLETQIANAVADQYDSNNVIFDNDPTTGHGIGFAVTSEGVKNAIDNAIGGLTIPEELNDLSDVDISGQAIGEALVWDGTKWVNGTVSTVGSLDDLNDVDTTGEADCDSLVYDANSGNWLPHRLIVSLTQAEFDTLELGGNLEPNTDYIITDSASVDLNLGDLTDVDTTGASTGDILVKGANGWESSGVSVDILTPSVTGPAIKIFKYGKMRQLWVNTQTYSNSGDVQIGSVPNDSNPTNMIRFYFGDKSHYISIETDGKIISSNGETYVVANIVYMVS